MTASDQKRRAASAALKFIHPGMVVGVGTGSTVEYFIEALANSGERLEGVIASSEATATALKARRLPLMSLNQVNGIDVYVDGADEANPHLQLIKGGGGALTREKICAVASREFVCIIDASKEVAVLGAFRVPVEVLPMAQSLVGRAVLKLGGQPDLRVGKVTDNGNIILDVDFGDILDPAQLERELKALTGVVDCGIFAARRADVLLVGEANGVREVRPRHT
jgi:ribose 5-phosphate isomerase A